MHGHGRPVTDGDEAVYYGLVSAGLPGFVSGEPG